MHTPPHPPTEVLHLTGGNIPHALAPVMSDITLLFWLLLRPTQEVLSKLVYKTVDHAPLFLVAGKRASGDWCRAAVRKFVSDRMGGKQLGTLDIRQVRCVTGFWFGSGRSVRFVRSALVHEPTLARPRTHAHTHARTQAMCYYGETFVRMLLMMYHDTLHLQPLANVIYCPTAPPVSIQPSALEIQVG